MEHDIYSIQWEYEDDLPEMDDMEFDHVFHYSQVIDGVRQYPFITIYQADGTCKKIYLGA